MIRIESRTLLHIAVLLTGLLAGPAAMAQAPGAGAGGSRGALLYSTHCVACHTTQVHWREKRLATDWTSLKAQVQRWQVNAGQRWDDSDVTAVAQYLNTLHYHYEIPAR